MAEMIDAADAIAQLLLSQEDVTEAVEGRIYGTDLPGELTDGWDVNENVLPTIFADADEAQARAGGRIVDCTARVLVFGPTEEDAASVAELVLEALCPGGEPSRRLAAGDYLFADVRQDGAAERGKEEATGWPTCTLRFGMGIVKTS